MTESDVPSEDYRLRPALLSDRSYIPVGRGITSSSSVKRDFDIGRIDRFSILINRTEREPFLEICDVVDILIRAHIDTICEFVFVVLIRLDIDRKDLFTGGNRNRYRTIDRGCEWCRCEIVEHYIRRSGLEIITGIVADRDGYRLAVNQLAPEG